MANVMMPAAAPPKPWTFPVPSTFTLGNGVQVAHCHLAGRPLTCVDLVLHVALHEEPAGFDGANALLAAALVRGPEMAATEPRFDVALEVLGATLEGKVDPYAIRLRLVCPSDQVQPALRLLTRAVQRLHLPPDRVRSISYHQSGHAARAVAQQGRTGISALQQHLFGAAGRYGRSKSGDPLALQRMRGGDLLAHAVSVVDPARATIVITSGKSAAELRPLIEGTIGAWTPGTPAAAAAVSAVPEPPGDVVVIEQPSSVQAQLVFGALGPQPGEPNWPALLVALHQLAGAQMSLLDRILREEKGFTFGVKLIVEPTPAGSTVAVASFVDLARCGSALREVHAVLDRLQRDGVSAADRDSAVRSMRDAAPRQLQTVQSVTSTVTEAVSRGLPPQYAVELFAKLATVRGESMSRVLAEVFAPARLTTVVVADGGTLAGLRTEAVR